MQRENQGRQGPSAGAADYCSMCGQHWFSVRINKEVRDAIQQKVGHPAE